MKTYKSHKTVEAAKIDAVQPAQLRPTFTQDGWGHSLKLEGGCEELVTSDWAARHAPNGGPSMVGGYFVRYPDGYTSWSPAEAFEEGYTEVADDSADRILSGLREVAESLEAEQGAAGHAAVTLQAQRQGAALQAALCIENDRETADAVLANARKFSAFLGE